MHIPRPPLIAVGNKARQRDGQATPVLLLLAQVKADVGVRCGNSDVARRERVAEPRVDESGCAQQVRDCAVSGEVVLYGGGRRVNGPSGQARCLWCGGLNRMRSTVGMVSSSRAVRR